MKCWFFKKRLYLYRQGELTAEQKRGLEKHLDSCDRCRQEACRILEIEQWISPLRTDKPVLPRPEEMTDRIMNRIRTGKAQPRPESPADPQRIFYGRIPRFVFAALALLVIGSFFYQEFYFLARISRLEQRMAVLSEARANHLNDPRMQQLSAEFWKSSLRNQPGLRIPGTKPDNPWVLIKKSDLDSLIRDSRHSRILSDSDLEQIRRVFADLGEQDFKTLSNAIDRDWLLRHRRELIHRIDRL